MKNTTQNKLIVVTIVAVYLAIAIAYFLGFRPDYSLLFPGIAILGYYLLKKEYDLLQMQEDKLDERQLQEKLVAMNISYKLNWILYMGTCLVIVAIPIIKIISTLLFSTETIVTNNYESMFWGLLWIMLGILNTPYLVLRWKSKQ